MARAVDAQPAPGNASPDNAAPAHPPAIPLRTCLLDNIAPSIADRIVRGHPASPTRKAKGSGTLRRQDAGPARNELQPPARAISLPDSEQARQTQMDNPKLDLQGSSSPPPTPTPET